MIRFSSLCLATLALLAGRSLPAAYAITFPDKNLEAALRTMVYEKRTNMEELTDEDLRKISTLEARGKKIQNLSGIEKCANILLIDLSENEISDLGPLRGLVGLQSLSLANNKIADLTPLMELNKLQYLNLSGNQIKAL
jgi:internalin A